MTEATHLIHMAKLYALSSIHYFTLIESGYTLFRSPACEVITDRVKRFRGGLSNPGSLSGGGWGDGHADLLANLASRSTRKEMIFFVNRRPVDGKPFLMRLWSIPPLCPRKASIIDSFRD